MPRTRPGASILHCNRDALHAAALPFATVQKMCIMYTVVGAPLKVYPHEIDIQETHTKHRKLDSQATLSHRARGRAPDGLRPQVRPLWASRRDHDPGRLSPRSAGLRGLRPAMASDRTLRGPPARSPGEEWNPQCAPNPG